MSTQHSSTHPSRTVTRLARGLGWFSIALGAAELLMTRKTSRATGLRGSKLTVRAYGAREIATGVALLASRDPTPWLWTRVSGDALDIATLASASVSRRPRDRQRALMAIAAVAGVTALDIACAEAARRDKRRAQQALQDYSDRSGFPLPPQEMRGVALKDVDIDADMRTPAALRPYTSPQTPTVVAAEAETIGLR